MTSRLLLALAALASINVVARHPDCEKLEGPRLLKEDKKKDWEQREAAKHRKRKRR